MKGRMYHGDFVMMKVAAGIIKGCSRWAMSVSKKTAKNAVDRNRLRRRGYAAVASFSDIVVRDRAIIIFFKKEALNADSHEIERDIKRVCATAGVCAR
jgi:ribonuclease P protein component